MNKSWRLTAVFAGLLVVLSAVYFLSKPPATTPTSELESPRVVDLLADRVSKIEVDRKGTALVFERANDKVGEYWRIAGPNSHAADNSLVQQMLFGLDRFLKAGGLEPGKPETAPEITGLLEPRLTVAFTADGRREVLRFGKSPPTNTTAVFYQREGDPKIYLVSVDTFEAYNKPVFQYRAKALVRYSPHRIAKVTLEYKFIRPQGKDKPDLIEYESSTMERFEQGMERGWYLVQPHREKLDDHKVQALVTELSSLQAGEYQPAGNPKDQGLDEPQARVSLWSAGEDQPVVVQFGAPAERGKKRWVSLKGAPEVALYESFRYDDLPLQRNHLRNSAIFAFTAELVKRLEIEAKDLGKVVLERREVKKEGEAVGTVKWEVVEPADLRVESERLEAFVGAVMVQSVTGFLGAQDFKLAGLEPPPVRLTVVTKEGKIHNCGFSVAAQGYLRKDGVNEIFEVRPDFVRMLQRLELNFINPEMFNIPRDHLREFGFEGRFSGDLPVSYALTADEKTRKWAFKDPVFKGKEIDPDRLGGILAGMNYIKADALIGRDEALIRKHRLTDDRTAAGVLKITYEKGIADLYVSDNLSNVPGRSMYYARFKDNATVFQISPVFVESLKKAPVKQAEDKEK
jgi:hypothetical protein